MPGAVPHLPLSVERLGPRHWVIVDAAGRFETDRRKHCWNAWHPAERNAKRYWTRKHAVELAESMTWLWTRSKVYD